MEVSLLNSSGALINSYNPSTQVQAVLDSTLNAGDYYISVKNVSNMYTTNYGMLGNYSLGGTFTAAGTLPIHSMTLSGSVTKEKHELNWDILADEPVESITIETATDGKTFSTLQVLNGSYRKYSTQPTEKTITYYRLKAVTASQLSYYSNIISLKEINSTSKYSLLTTLVQDQINFNSKENLGWRLIDMNGRTLQNGRAAIGINRIDVARYSSGMYLLQLTDGASVVAIEKLVKN
jgi:hypothetical protein